MKNDFYPDFCPIDTKLGKPATFVGGSLTKKGSIIFLLLITVFFMVSCAKPYELNTRLDSFYALLDEPNKENFKEGNLKAVSGYLTEKLKTPELRDQLDALKEQEAIILFSTDQTVEYFYQYLYLKELEKSS